MSEHLNIGLFLKNSSDKNHIIEEILGNRFLRKFFDLCFLQGGLYSSLSINRFIDEELRHDHFIIQTDKNPGLYSMSSGERKKALLKYLINQKPDFLILDDVYSNIDAETQKSVTNDLIKLGKSILLIQIFFRKKDVLSCINKVLTINENNKIVNEQSFHDFTRSDSLLEIDSHPVRIPRFYHNSIRLPSNLVELYSVSASYGKKRVLNNISWTIKKNEFWQLSGPNGSGKSTLVSMLTGDNPFGYGQNIILFGRKKGTGESIWDIKQKIGYFSPAMIHRFYHNDSVENMIVSGFKDSVGLYSRASNMQQDIANRWIELLNLKNGKQKFNQLSTGRQRMVMVARAMVKHPPLLILDEPTIELDDENSSLFVEMINAIRAEYSTAIIYVSHREEKGLKPDKIFELIPAAEGFTGKIHY